MLPAIALPPHAELGTWYTLFAPVSQLTPPLVPRRRYLYSNAVPAGIATVPSQRWWLDVYWFAFNANVLEVSQVPS